MPEPDTMTFSDMIEKAADQLVACGVREVYVFGSAGIGETDEFSDLDLAVVGLPPEKCFHAMGRAHGVIPRSLDLIDLDQDNPFTRFLREEGLLRRVR